MNIQLNKMAPNTYTNKTVWEKHAFQFIRFLNLICIIFHSMDGWYVYITGYVPTVVLYKLLTMLLNQISAMLAS